MPEPSDRALRIRRLREYYGSHDKLAAALRDLGATGVSRQRVIAWEKGVGPSRYYAELLAELDPDATVADYLYVPAGVLDLKATVQEGVLEVLVQEQFPRLQALAAAVAEVAENQAEVLERLGLLERQVEQLEAAPTHRKNTGGG